MLAGGRRTEEKWRRKAHATNDGRHDVRDARCDFAGSFDNKLNNNLELATQKYNHIHTVVQRAKVAGKRRQIPRAPFPSNRILGTDEFGTEHEAKNRLTGTMAQWATASETACEKISLHLMHLMFCAYTDIVEEMRSAG